MYNDWQIAREISNYPARSKNGKIYKWAGRSNRSLPEILLVSICTSQWIVTKILKKESYLNDVSARHIFCSLAKCKILKLFLVLGIDTILNDLRSHKVSK
jgi:hypothetical protein